MAQRKKEEKTKAQDREEKSKLEDIQEKEEKKKKVQEMLAMEKEVRDRENSLRQEFESLWSRSEIQSLFQTYTPSLTILFSHFSKKYAKSPLESGELYLNGVLRMVQELRIVPELCAKEVVVQVFRGVTKGKTGQLGLAFQDFIQLILRVSAVCQSQLSLLSSPDAVPSAASISQCDPSVILTLFSHIQLTPDPKRTIDRLKF